MNIIIFFFCIMLIYCLYNFTCNEKFTDTKTINTNDHNNETFTPRYFLTLCCIIKDERYLEEFIIYYNLLGVQHFYIYDNESSEPISERLDYDYFNNLVTVINFPGKVQQLNAYENCLKKYGPLTQWMIFVDGDEYILPKNTNTLDEFLLDYDDYHAIGINWVMFGSSYHEKKQDGYLIDKYRRRGNKQNPHIKTICKPKFTKHFQDPHTVILHDPTKYIDAKYNKIIGPFNDNHTIDIIQINHYYGKSIEEQIEKAQRGTPDRLENGYTPPKHNDNNDVVDDTMADRYLEELTTVMENIYTL